MGGKSFFNDFCVCPQNRYLGFKQWLGLIVDWRILYFLTFIHTRSGSERFFVKIRFLFMDHNDCTWSIKHKWVINYDNAWLVHAHTWSIYDHIWSVCDHIRATHDNIWPICDHTWSIYDHVWPKNKSYMAHVCSTSGHISSYMVHIMPHLVSCLRSFSVGGVACDIHLVFPVTWFCLLSSCQA